MILYCFALYEEVFNETATIIIGNDSLQCYAGLQSREEYIIIQILKDLVIFKNVAEDKYTYEQLKELRLNYMLEENHFACTPYNEINNSIIDIFNSMNKKLRTQNLNILIAEKIKDKELNFQNVITFIALLLTCQPITDYILLPLCQLYYNVLNFEYNLTFLKIIMFILSISIVALFYFIIKGKNFK